MGKSKYDADIIIIGGGAAGLSLAVSLSYLVDLPRILILEVRPKYTNDRTWCFWGKQSLNRHLPISRSWSSWSFSANGKHVTHESEHWHYHHIAAEDFYHFSQSLLRLNPHCLMHMNTKVDKLEASKDGVKVITGDQHFFARQVVDTRPPELTQVTTAPLFQIFYGAEVTTSSPVFNQQIPMLMDRLNDTSLGLTFNYLLPLEENRALIELTAFSPKLFAPETLRPILTKLLRYRFSPHKDWKISREEQAVLPMGMKLSEPDKDSNIILAGMNAGALRPSSGYAFLRIQAWAKKCAEHYRKWSVIPHLDSSSPTQRTMDSLFLDVLSSNETSASNLFIDMADRVNADCFARFMSDNATPLDNLKVINAMPAAPFIKAAVSNLQSAFQRINSRDFYTNKKQF